MSEDDRGLGQSFDDPEEIVELCLERVHVAVGAAVPAAAIDGDDGESVPEQRLEQPKGLAVCGGAVDEHDRRPGPDDAARKVDPCPGLVHHGRRLTVARP